MLLLDSNNAPTNTVYYISAISYGILKRGEALDLSALYRKVSEYTACKPVSFDFYMMALDFLFLLDKVYVDRKGYLHVH
ncbi:hypothetical protein DWY61_05300 [Bifidobacterium longum]|uniref:ABC-three component system middle component 6 n=1 Tax=Bifidobacterium longum TaxID=216816 RepID=UPI000E4C0A5C|nr:hypothetical protein DWY61_05300 [Bifidobacterium longum]DAO52630.1 MAG TPA: hypothetical protein [Caudoviricetes sp.]